MCGLTQLVVSLCQDIGLAKRRLETARILGERGTARLGKKLVLFGAFAIKEEKELVLDDRPANAATELIALERRLDAGRRGQPGGDGAVSKEPKGLAVEAVRARARGHVNRS